MAAHRRIFGFHPVHEALRGGAAGIERIYVLERRHGGRREEIEALAARAGIAV
jgi:tRNA G18 (ribose-2'-O)-methylase SpoU